MNGAETVSALLRRCKVSFTFLEAQDDGRVLVSVPLQKHDPLNTIRKLYAGMDEEHGYSILYGMDVRRNSETFMFSPRK